jgi:hypothetical protein
VSNNILKTNQRILLADLLDHLYQPNNLRFTKCLGPVTAINEFDAYRSCVSTVCVVCDLSDREHIRSFSIPTDHNVGVCTRSRFQYFLPELRIVIAERDRPKPDCI